MRAGERGRLAWTRFRERRQPPAPPAPPVLPAQPPESVLELLRHLGVALGRAGESADGVTVILEDVAGAYDAHGVTFFVLPTGVFARIDAGGASRIDFAPGSNDPLRLDQIDALYRLVDDIRRHRLDVDEATARLLALLGSQPRFGALVTILGTAILTIGLGLVLNPTASALPAYLVLGLLVGVLRWWADRDETLASVLTVTTAFLVTWLAFELAGPLLNTASMDIVIPSLVTLLPGAALTMATVELSAGSIVSGSARLVFGLERLLLLSFGIVLGTQLAGLPTGLESPGAPLGAWAPWLGVLIFGLGQYLASSAPPSALVWLLLVLYVAYAAQVASAPIVGALGSSFVAAVVVLPVASSIQRTRRGPPVPVTFLPAFWLLVPGALGLEGVTELVGADQVAGLGDFINALLSMVAIAVGVLVGSGLSERLVTPRKSSAAL